MYQQVQDTRWTSEEQARLKYGQVCAFNTSSKSERPAKLRWYTSPPALFITNSSVSVNEKLVRVIDKMRQKPKNSHEDGWKVSKPSPSSVHRGWYTLVGRDSGALERERSFSGAWYRRTLSNSRGSLGLIMVPSGWPYNPRARMDSSSRSFPFFPNDEVLSISREPKKVVPEFDIIGHGLLFTYRYIWIYLVVEGLTLWLFVIIGVKCDSSDLRLTFITFT